MRKIIPLLVGVSFICGCASTTGGRLQAPEAASTAAFTRTDTRTIARYYRPITSRSRVAGKVAARGFVQGTVLPPYAARQRLPEDLEARLSPPPAGYVRVKTGTTLLLLDKQSSLIADSFEL